MNDFHYLSKKLSEVLDDIGVNERIVMNRRYLSLLTERIQSMMIPVDFDIQLHFFGSSVEGTTTLGLDPDNDVLISDNRVNVVQHKNESKPKAINLMMVHDESPPGYCLLQYLTSDLSVDYEYSKHGSSERIFLKKTSFCQCKVKDLVQNGPALTRSAGIFNQDIVFAVTCKSWPQTASTWLQKHGKGDWPTDEMKMYCKSTRCFVVPVASVGRSQNEDVEWRISTALAERYLMFTLNITQIQCFVLMKLICKSYLNPSGECKVSSYICKNVLLHCVENTSKDFWSEANLIRCLNSCFIMLRDFISLDNCPHFIIRENNLLAGRLSPGTRGVLLAKMENLMQSSAVMKILTAIQTDALGERLNIKLNIRNDIEEYCLATQEEIERNINHKYWIALANVLSNIYRSLYEVKLPLLFKLLFEILSTINNGNDLCQKACYLTTPFLFTTIGSAIASANIYSGMNISKEALFWFSFGISSDVLSSRLKIASAHYCAGNMYAAHLILRDIETRSDLQKVFLVCGCPSYNNVLKGFFPQRHPDTCQSFVAFCVCFFSYEVHCVPKELQYELFRYTDDEVFGKEYTNHWNVDSLYFLHFLEYKIYGQLMQRKNQINSLSKFILDLHLYPNFGHKETAMNLLGQCLEQEKQDIDAFCCYLKSLEISNSHNAAKWHICILIAKLVKQKTRARNCSGISVLKTVQLLYMDAKKDIYGRLT